MGTKRRLMAIVLLAAGCSSKRAECDKLQGAIDGASKKMSQEPIDGTSAQIEAKADNASKEIEAAVDEIGNTPVDDAELKEHKKQFLKVLLAKSELVKQAKAVSANQTAWKKLGAELDANNDEEDKARAKISEYCR
jgi:hypothetical protein